MWVCSWGSDTGFGCSDGFGWVGGLEYSDGFWVCVSGMREVVMVGVRRGGAGVGNTSGGWDKLRWWGGGVGGSRIWGVDTGSRRGCAHGGCGDVSGREGNVSNWFCFRGQIQLCCWKNMVYYELLLTVVCIFTVTPSSLLCDLLEFHILRATSHERTGTETFKEATSTSWQT
jgi:hypothetical protein